jgi:hypothetical protein
MPWSNTIPNPFTVGGGGISGQIIVYDALGRVLATIDQMGITFYDATGIPITVQDETGLSVYDLLGNLAGKIDDAGITAYGDFNSYVWMVPNIDPGFYGDTAGLKIYPANPSALAIDTAAYLVCGFTFNNQPVLSLNSPSFSGVPGSSYVDVVGTDAPDSFGGNVFVFAGGTDGFVDLAPGAQIGGDWICTKNEGVSGAGTVGNTTSATYVNMPGSASFSFTKKEISSRVRVRMDNTFILNGTNTTAQFGVLINGTDYDVCHLHLNPTAQHALCGGQRFITGLAPGTYTVQGRWRRSLGTATLNTDTNDQLNIYCEEIA